MSAARKPAIALVRLVIPAGAAKPSPPVGPALGQHGVNIMMFCKDFNAKTAEHKAAVPVPVEIAVYADKTFTWVMKTPPTSYFVAKVAGIAKGSMKPGHSVAGSMSAKHAYEIAKVKATDSSMAHLSLEAITRGVIGTARSMGVVVTK